MWQFPKIDRRQASRLDRGRSDARAMKRAGMVVAGTGLWNRLVRKKSFSDTASVSDLNVLGGPLEPCGTDPMTGFFRDGCCATTPEDLGSHTICAVVTKEFLEHQLRIGNDLVTPMPQYQFPGLAPGDRWCVTARNWLRAHVDGAASFVVLASTNVNALEIVPLEVLTEHAVDVPTSLDEL